MDVENGKELKGEDPLWWAGSPYDSGSSPEPPDSWSNSKQGGIHAYANGTAVGWSGPRAMAAGESISYVFSLMVTPVRPFDLKERFQERWAQLGGPSNYSQLADAGVTVVNMHQGNEINVSLLLHLSRLFRRSCSYVYLVCSVRPSTAGSLGSTILT